MKLGVVKQLNAIQCLCHDNEYPLRCKYKAVLAQLQDTFILAICHSIKIIPLRLAMQ